jgi:hypothetical protein
MSYLDDNDNEKPRVFGSVEFTGKDIAVPGQRFDRIALSGRGELLLLSVVTDIYNLKRMRAILCGGAKATIDASGIRVARSGDDYWRASTPGRILVATEGYQCYSQKFNYGIVHALFLTRMPGFMKIVTLTSLWQELNHIRFTTPIIPEWMPHIEERLRANEYLKDAYCFNCKCGLLTAQTRQLDEIVSQGIQQRLIYIPPPNGIYPGTTTIDPESAILAFAG